MPRWLISVPVWGERCVNVFCATALPALENSILRLQKDHNIDAVLVVHTDEPNRIISGATQISIEPRPLPAGARDYDCMSQGHREVLSMMACRQDRVALLTADLIISENGLSFCERRLQAGDKWLICCASIRVLEEGLIPSTSDNRALMKWAWDRRHPMTTEATWPNGRIGDMSRLCFTKAANVNTRVCLPHPLAVKVVSRPLKFTPTIDTNLMQNFHQGEIHVVNNPDDLVLFEMSPRDKDFGIGEKTMQQRFHEGTLGRVGNPLQRWVLNQRITVLGNGDDCGDAAITSAMLDRG